MSDIEDKNKRKNITAICLELRQMQRFMKQVAAWQRLPAKKAAYAGISHPINPSLTTTLQQANLPRFYKHQAEAINQVIAGNNVVVATATASGKSLCYTVPVLDRLLNDPIATALYLFPTKALAQDQLAATARLVNQLETSLPVHTYDGDTARSQRTKIRKSGRIVISNPDMLHAGILPYHTRWRQFLSQLNFIVIDEIHSYRGVFGSHVANVIRRLQRICAFYGSQPQIICCSATIANPKEHAQKLTGRLFSLVDERQNGAPQGEKQFILYNPPIIDEELGLRQSVTLAARDAAFTFLRGGEQTVVFARARQTVELLLTYLQDDMEMAGKNRDLIRGYRGGYLPLERREIEQGLRDGNIRGVVATNALELGVDIGELSAAIITGYPGTIAGTWQQAGRAGRRGADSQSAVILVAGSGALDQYICRHPRYLFGNTPEHALINPDNPRLLSNHLQCAAFELPWQQGEKFGEEDVDELLEALADAGIFHKTRDQYHYLGEEVPAHIFSLRTSGNDTVLIHETSSPQTQVIGELDLESVPYMVYEGAIYMHQARTFQVTDLDWEGRLAQVQPVSVDYYTRATVGSRITHLAAQAEIQERGTMHLFGEATIITQATGYRKIRRYTHETLGYGGIDLPEMTLETMGYWLIFGEELTAELENAGILLAANDYGPHWQTQRQKTLTRDNHRCRTCGAQAQSGQGLHIHHIKPFREFFSLHKRSDLQLPNLQSLARANHIDNLITLCPSCHRRAEEGQQARSAMGGLGYVLRNLAPLFLMCDPGDIAVSAESRSPLTGAPTVVIYERVPAGIGFSQKLFESREKILAAALELVTDCRCRDGCPACVGPPGDIGPDTKAVTRKLLTRLTMPAPAL